MTIALYILAAVAALYLLIGFGIAYFCGRLGARLSLAEWVGFVFLWPFAFRTK